MRMIMTMILIVVALMRYFLLQLKLEKGKRNKTNWIKKDLIKALPILNVNKGNAPQVLTPVEYFKLFMTDELVNDIVLQSNLYSVQQKLQPVSTTSAEIEQYIGHALTGDGNKSGSIIQNVLVR